MITKLDESFSHLRIGLLGFRHPCLISALDKYGLNYQILNKIKEINSDLDLVIESGVYDIIPEKYLHLPKYGIVGFHESPVPQGKGHAPLQWAVLNNQKNIVITLYKLNSKVDDGEVILQHNMEILPTDTLVDLESKRQKGITICLANFLEELKEGVIVLRKQSGFKSYHTKRTPEDSALDPSKTLLDLWDSIRVCDNKDFPSFFIFEGKKIILRYEVVDHDSK